MQDKSRLRTARIRAAISGLLPSPAPSECPEGTQMEVHPSHKEIVDRQEAVKRMHAVAERVAKQLEAEGRRKT